MIDNDVLTGKEIVEICNTYPNAKVSFEAITNGCFSGGSCRVYAMIRGYKLVKGGNDYVTEIIFVEDSVVPRNAPKVNEKK